MYEIRKPSSFQMESDIFGQLIIYIQYILHITYLCYPSIFQPVVQYRYHTLQYYDLRVVNLSSVLLGAVLFFLQTLNLYHQTIEQVLKAASIKQVLRERWKLP